MKKFTRFLALVLSLVLLLALFAACNKDDEQPAAEPTAAEKAIAAAAAEPTELEVAFVTDTHLMSVTGEIVNYENAGFVKREITSQKLNFMSEALMKQLVDDVIASGVKILLVGGDVTETSAIVAHETVNAEFARLEAAGVNVWVVPGNHDVARESNACYRYEASGAVKIDGISETTKLNFANYYTDFGYSGTNRMADSLNYSVELNGKYTLIALDNNSPTFLTNELEAQNWAVAQVQTAVEAGKTPILMLHQPLEEIFSGLYNTLGLSLSGSFTKGCTSFATRLAAAGLRYTLTGHVHSNAVTKVAYDADGDSSNGKEAEILQVMGMNTTSYGGGFRIVRFTENYVEATYHPITAIKEEHLASYLSAEDKAAVLADWSAFSLAGTKADLTVKLGTYLSLIKGYLSQYVLGTEFDDLSATMQTKVTTFSDNVVGILSAPYYEEDAKNGEMSVERLLKNYGLADGVLPETSYSSILDVATTLVNLSYASGEEEFKLGSPEITLIKYGVYAVFAALGEYDLFGLMKDAGMSVTNADSTAVLTQLVTTGNVNLLSSSILGDILSIDALDSIDNALIAGLLSTPVQELLDAAYALLPVLSGGFDVDFESYFVVDEVATAADPDGMTHLTGEIRFGALFDEVVVSKLAAGAIYVDYVGNDFVIERATLVGYIK